MTDIVHRFLAFRSSRALAALTLLSGLVALCPSCVIDPGESASPDEPIGTAEEDLGLPNLAVGKYAYQSSVHDGGDAAHAVDGNTDGDFHHGSITHTGYDINAWWAVDLGSQQAVGDIVIYNRTDCCGSRLSNFDVLYSMDGQTWQSGAQFPGTVAKEVMLGINVTTRFIKVQLRGQNYLSLAEVRVFPQAEPQNLALGRPTEQSSTYAGQGASSHAVDGNTNGSWYQNSITHTNYDAHAWWRVDLESVQALGTVDIWNRTDCCSNRLSNFVVEVSDEDTSSPTFWRTVGSYPGTAPERVALTLIDPATGTYVRARHLRVRLLGTNNLSLAEVLVHPPPVFAYDPQNPFDARYVIASRENGRVLDDTHWLADWADTPAQSWRLAPTPDGRFQLESAPQGILRSLTDTSYTYLDYVHCSLIFSCEPITYTYRSYANTTPTTPPASGARWDLRDVGGGYFQIISPNFGEYLQGGGSLAIAPWSGALRQYWRILPAVAGDNDDDGRARVREDAADNGITLVKEADPAELQVALPPALTSFNLPAVETARVLIGDTPVPYYFVNDPLRTSRAAQVQNNPYYRLTRERFWTAVATIGFDANSTGSTTRSYSYEFVNTSSQSVTSTVDVTVTGSASLSFGPLSASLSYSVKRSLSTTSTTGTSAATTQTTSVTRSHTAGQPSILYVFYDLTDQYTLTDRYDNIVTQWKFIDDTIQVERTYTGP